MNGKIKAFTLIAGIVIFGLGIYLFTLPVESAEEKSRSLPEDKEEIRKLKEELTRYSDYFNLVEDKKILEKEIIWLHDRIFELEKQIIQSGDPASPEILYQEADDSNIVTLLESDLGYTELRLKSRGDEYPESIYVEKLLEEEVMNINFGDYGLLGGMYSGEFVGSINLYQNAQSRQAEMLEIDKEINIWYIKLDQSVRSMNGLQDEIRVDAVDGEGNMVYRQEFEW